MCELFHSQIQPSFIILGFYCSIVCLWHLAHRVGVRQGVWPPGSKPARGDNSIAIDTPFRPADADEDCADIRVLPRYVSMQ